MTLPDRNPQLAPNRVIDTTGRMVRVREQRAPAAATQALTWQSPGMAQIPEWDAAQAIRWAYYANVIVYRCCQIRANTIASLPFRAGRTAPAKPTDVGDPDDRARLAQLLGPPPGGPAPKLTARRLWAWSIVQRIVTGKHAWEIEETSRGGSVVALWPLVSSSLREIPAAGGTEWFSAFEYGRHDKPKRLMPDQILFGWDPGARDFRQPESALQAASLDVSIAVMMDRYNVAFLRNDARPAAVVVTEAFAERDDFDAFKAQLNSEYRGPDNAGKTMVVEAEGGGEAGVAGAIDVKVLGLSQRDARFIEQHKASLERVAMALGVPWSKLDASGRTFDNATEEDHAWWESTILPQVMDLQDEVNMQLAPRLGREVGWFDLSQVRALQAPKNVQAVGAPSLVTGGIATVNEARATVGLAPVEGGDVLLDAIAIAMAALQAQTGEPAPAPTEQVEVEPAAPVEPAEPLALAASAPVGEDRAVAAEDQEVRRTRIWRTADAVVKGLERQWERRWTAMFDRQAKATLARLEGKRGRQAMGGDIRETSGNLFDPDFWRGESLELAADLYESVFAAGGSRIAGMFGISFDLAAPYAQDFISRRANQLAGQVTDTTYRAIQEALAAGVAEGEAVPELAARLRHVFDVASTSRSTVIARTEVISAYNGSAATVAASLGAEVVAAQEWIATRDGRTREDHAEADGQVQLMGHPFEVGGEALAYPGDPAGSPDQVIQCRCTIAFLTPDEMEGRTRMVDRTVASAVLALVEPGTFDEARIRRALEVAA